MNCPVCSSKSKLVMCLHDDRYGYSGEYPLKACINCGHKFLDANFSPTDLNILYSTYYPRSTFKVECHCPHVVVSGFFGWLSGAASSAFRWVPPNVRVLDIGCGFGESLGYHKARGCEVYGVEADANIRRVAEYYGYQVHVGLFDKSQYQPAFFDYVTMDQVLEHTQHPVDVLTGVAEVLKPGGLAIVSIPNADGWGSKLFGKRWINWHTPYHLQFFSIRSMEMLARDAGFEILKTTTLTPSAWLDFQWSHLLDFPKEGHASAFWMHHPSAGLKHRVMKRLFRFMDQCKLNHLITRLFDSIGLGDNRLYFLRKR